MKRQLVNLASAVACLASAACATQPAVAVIGDNAPAATVTSSSTLGPASPPLTSPTSSSSSTVPPSTEGAGASLTSTAISTSPSPTPASAPTAEQLTPGLHPLETEVGGLRRTWELVVPAGPVRAARPLLIVLHGVGARGDDMRGFGFEASAGPAGVLVAYPDAWDGSWNDGRTDIESTAHLQQVDDVGFLRAVVAKAQSVAGADPTRIAVVGFSNGALMAGRLACEAADLLAGAAMVAGSGAQGLSERCAASRPVSVLIVHGTADAVVPFNGGTIAAYKGRRRGAAAPVAAMVATWAKRNGCTSSAEGAVGADPRRVVEVRGVDCPGGYAVRLDRIEGGGHEWYSGNDFATTATVWRFFAETAFR